MIYNLYSIIDKKNVGTKAHNLMLLKRSDYNVPDGFVLSKKLCKKIKKNNISKEVKKQIKEYLKQIDVEEPFPLVVRSSSTFEDTSKKSFAGQYKSVINVDSEKKLFLAIKEVIFSEKKKHLKSYSKKPIKDSMAVIIQKQINPKYSGVLFTKNPITNKGFLIEYVKGHLKEMISGRANSKKINKIKELNKTFKELYNQGKQIEEYFKKPQDIEFAIDKNHKIWILQTRNITTKTNVVKKKINKKLKEIKGVTLSNGYAKGKMQYVSDAIVPEDAYKNFNKGNILVTYLLFPEYDAVFKKAKAVICHIDSITSHAAIIARENNIPCIGGIDIPRLLKETNHLDEVIVDANKSKIYYQPKIKIYETKKREIFKPKIIKTKEFEKDKKELVEYIINCDYKKIDKKLTEMTKLLRTKFKSYLKTKNKKDLKLAKSYFRNIMIVLQDDVYELLLKKHKKEEIINVFTKIDSGKKAISNIEKTYKVIKERIQKHDKFTTVNGKEIWRY